MSESIKTLREEVKGINENINRRVKSIIPLQFRYIFGAYFLSIVFMAIYRVVAFAIHCFFMFNLADLNIWLLFRSLLIGLRYDIVVLCLITSIYTIIMMLTTMFNFNKRYIYRPLHLILCFICFCIFFVSVIDVAYLTYSNEHISIIGVSWLRTPKYIIDLIASNPKYLLYGAFALLSIAWFFVFMHRIYDNTIFKTIAPYDAKQPKAKTIAVGCFMLLLCFVGIDQKTLTNKSLTVSTAYFCDNDFYNQLAVGPVFNIIKSSQEERALKDTYIPPIDIIKSQQIVEQEFANRDDNAIETPILPEKTNIVLILLEDITENDITSRQMPNLYRIKNSSLQFTNVYSDGVLFYNGLYSTLFAQPNLFSANSMGGTLVPKMQNLAMSLQQLHYKTMYFTTIAQKQNNISRFLTYNGMNHIYSGEKIGFSQEIATLDKTTSPFLACILLNKPQKSSQNSQDKELNNLISLAKTKSWYNKTLFVIVGANAWEEKIPLLFYNPNLIKSGKNDNLASQLDITPTLLAMIDQNYKNTTFGLNIFSDRRSFAFSSADSELRVYGGYYQYSWNKKGEEKLLRCEAKDSISQNPQYYWVDCTKQEPAQARKMREYAFAMMQTSQYKISQIKLKKQ